MTLALTCGFICDSAKRDQHFVNTANFMHRDAHNHAGSDLGGANKKALFAILLRLGAYHWVLTKHRQGTCPANVLGVRFWSQ